MKENSYARKVPSPTLLLDLMLAKANLVLDGFREPRREASFFP